jgi:allantoicase
MLHQGANDGFRAVFLKCYQGPDFGLSLVCYANGDNRAMVMIAEAMQAVLRARAPSGVDLARFGAQQLSFDHVPQEQIVNLGYKTLVFAAFQPTLPDPILAAGPEERLAGANRAAGAAVLSVSSQRFARAENLVSKREPTFDPELFCAMGKVMDSWETARHNEAGVDVVLLSLRQPAEARFLRLCTKFHYGNQAEAVRISGRDARTAEWHTLLAKTKMDGHSWLAVELPAPHHTVDQLRVEMFPDGGLSRVALFDAALPAQDAALFKPAHLAKNNKYADPIPATKKPLQLLFEAVPAEVEANRERLVPGLVFDAASLELGAELVSVTNQHYGPAAQVFSPFMPLSMHDGFESARSREPGHHEELVVKLGVPAIVQQLEFDFTFFVNNNPKEVAVMAKSADSDWTTIVPRTYVKPFAGNTKLFQVASATPTTHLKLLVFPDGGINRVRAFATLPHSKAAL